MNFDKLFSDKETEEILSKLLGIKKKNKPNLFPAIEKIVDRSNEDVIEIGAGDIDLKDGAKALKKGRKGIEITVNALKDMLLEINKIITTDKKVKTRQLVENIAYIRMVFDQIIQNLEITQAYNVALGDSEESVSDMLADYLKVKKGNASPDPLDLMLGAKMLNDLLS